MTVKCVDNAEKDIIVDLYRAYGISVTQLAGDFEVSRKTIYRVLAEQGITCHRITKPKPKHKPLTIPQQFVRLIREKVFSFMYIGR